MMRTLSFAIGMFWPLVTYGQSPPPATAIDAPEQAVAALIQIHRDDAEVRRRFPDWVGDRLDAHSVKAWKASDTELEYIKTHVEEVRDDRLTLFCSPARIAEAQNVWKVRVREAGERMRTVVAYVDSNSRRVIFMVVGIPPYY